MYLAGISVRRVEDITEALWCTRVSPSTESNLNKKIYAKIEAWRNRRIEGEHPYLACPDRVVDHIGRPELSAHTDCQAFACELIDDVEHAVLSRCGCDPRRGRGMFAGDGAVNLRALALNCGGMGRLKRLAIFLVHAGS
jgi:Transposase, Mutator family